MPAGCCSTWPISGAMTCVLKEIDTATGMVLKEHNAKPHLTA